MLINEYRQYKCHTIMTILDTAVNVNNVSFTNNNRAINAIGGTL